MCFLSATAMAVAGVAASMAGTAAGMAGSFKAAKAAGERGEHERDIAYYEAAMLKIGGDVEQFKLGVEQLREFGSAIARGSATGSTMSFGSVNRILGETRKFHAMDHLLLADDTKNRVLEAQYGGDMAYRNAAIEANSLVGQGIGTLFSGIGQLAMTSSAFIDAGILPGSEASNPPREGASARRVRNYSSSFIMPSYAN